MPSTCVEGLVPETGFEPARRFQRHHLKVVRLPISPPGLIYSINKEHYFISFYRKLMRLPILPRIYFGVRHPGFLDCKCKIL